MVSKSALVHCTESFGLKFSLWHFLRRSLRGKYVFHAGEISYFHQVPAGEYRKFVEDVLAIYDPCLIDAGRLDEGFRSIVYPKDRKKKRPKKKKG